MNVKFPIRCNFKCRYTILESFTYVLKDKSNWLCEYKTIIYVLKSVVRKYNFTKFVDKKIWLDFYFQTSYDNFYGKKCIFFLQKL